MNENESYDTPPATQETNSQNTIIAASPLIAILTGGFLINFIAPLILWLVWKKDLPQVDQPAKNVINSQISWTIWVTISYIVCGILTLVLIGFLIIWIVPLLWLIFSIVHLVKMSNGDTHYVMPMTIKFLK